VVWIAWDVLVSFTGGLASLTDLNMATGEGSAAKVYTIDGLSSLSSFLEDVTCFTHHMNYLEIRVHVKGSFAKCSSGMISDLSVGR